KAALAKLGSPDPLSRTPDEDGRRIVPLDEGREWGWRLVNYMRYRLIRDQEGRRQQGREAQARFRARQRDITSGGDLIDAVAKTRVYLDARAKKNPDDWTEGR